MPNTYSKTPGRMPGGRVVPFHKNSPPGTLNGKKIPPLQPILKKQHRPEIGAIANVIARLTNHIIQELGWEDKKYKPEDYDNIIKTDPLLNACAELKSRIWSRSFGEYTYKVAEIQEWMRMTFADMRGTPGKVARKASRFDYNGFWAGEIIWDTDRSFWRVTSVNTLTTKHCKFEGTRNGLTGLRYRGGDREVVLPMDDRNPIRNKVIWLANDLLTEDPYGVGLARRAVPLVLAKNILLQEWVLAGKNQASGLLVGKADSTQNVPLLGADGKPMKSSDGGIILQSAVQTLRHEMEQWDSKSFICTDLANQIQWMTMSVDTNFFQTALQWINRQILLSQNAPSLTFEEGMSASLGTAGVSEAQNNILNIFAASGLEEFRDAFVETIVRPMLMVNFGITAQEGWGSFEVEETTLTDPNAKTTALNNLMTPVLNQIVPASDIGLVNKVRGLVGLPQQTEQDFLAQIQKSAIVQQIQMGGTEEPAADPAVAEGDPGAG